MRNTIAVITLALLCGCATQQPPKPAATFTPPPPIPSAPAAKSTARRTSQATPMAVSPVQIFVSRKIGDPAWVLLGWDPSPTPSVTGYNIYQGVASGQYTNRIDAGGSTTLSISNLVAATTYYFAATAYTADGLESDYSVELPFTTRGLVLPPGNFRITGSFAVDMNGPWIQETNWPPVIVSNPLGNTLWRLDAERIVP